MQPNSNDHLYIPTLEISYIERTVNEEGKLFEPLAKLIYRSEYV